VINCLAHHLTYSALTTIRTEACDVKHVTHVFICTHDVPSVKMVSMATVSCTQSSCNRLDASQGMLQRHQSPKLASKIASINLSMRIKMPVAFCLSLVHHYGRLQLAADGLQRRLHVLAVAAELAFTRTTLL
jgi:purine-nucleoside phosphorylase